MDTVAFFPSISPLMLGTSSVVGVSQKPVPACFLDGELPMESCLWRAASLWRPLHGWVLSGPQGGQRQL